MIPTGTIIHSCRRCKPWHDVCDACLPLYTATSAPAKGAKKGGGPHGHARKETKPKAPSKRPSPVTVDDVSALRSARDDPADDTTDDEASSPTPFGGRGPPKRSQSWLWNGALEGVCYGAEVGRGEGGE